MRVFNEYAESTDTELIYNSISPGGTIAWYTRSGTVGDFDTKRYITDNSFAETRLHPGAPPYLWLSSEEWIEVWRFTPNQDQVMFGSLNGANTLLGVYSDLIPWGWRSVSPTGNYVLLETATGGIFLIDVTPEKGEFLALDRNYYEKANTRYHATWSPGAAKLTFSFRDEAGIPQINIFEIRDRSESVLTQGAWPAWSPDGNWPAFIRSKQAYLIRPDGTDERPLFGGQSSVIFLSWAPDGRHLVYLVMTRYVETGYELEVHISDPFIDDISNPVSVITEDFATMFPAFVRDISWSPDGKWFLFRAAIAIREAPIPGYTPQWYYCNSEGCAPFSPPDMHNCRRVDWIGSHPTAD